MDNEKFAYSIDEAIRITGIGRTRFYCEINSGDIKSFKVGRRRLISADALKAWVQRLEDQSALEAKPESA